MRFDFDLIQESIEPLRKAFGLPLSGGVKLEVVSDEILRIIVQLPPDYPENAEAALHRFDEGWWLDNCHRSNGSLVFDYEVIS